MRTKQISSSRAALSLVALVFISGVLVANKSHAHAGPHGGVDTSPEPAGPSPFVVVAEGLSNPRSIHIDYENGSPVIYVAEAGHGGPSTAGGPCVTSANGDYDDCYGKTGAVVRMAGGVATRVVTGLPSIAGPNGGFAVGPSHVTVRGQTLYLSIANYGGPDTRSLLGRADPRFGQLLSIPLHAPGAARAVTNISAFEDKYNPDGDEHKESNPSGLAFSNGFGFYVTDAAANDLLEISPSGGTNLRHTFAVRQFPAPSFMRLPEGTMLPVQAVPTSVVRGPDGAYYVAEFTGFPFPKGAARIFRFGGTGQPTVFAEGFTNIIDIAFGPDGSLYVLEMAKNGLTSGDVTGAVTKIAPNGTRTLLASSGLAYPTAIAVDFHGNVYVANYGTHGSKAQLVRL